MSESNDGLDDETAAENETPGHVRGSAAVMAALIEAAGDMLGEVGPSRLSVRDVAARAGVNHGQVHHYFQGKRGLLEAAMLELARRHLELSQKESSGSPIPRALTLLQDPRYAKAICQVVMDGDLDLATLEMREGVSVPRRALDAFLDETQGVIDPLEVKARFVALASQQLGWIAFEEFLMTLAEVDEAERPKIRELGRNFIQQVVDHRAD